MLPATTGVMKRTTRMMIYTTNDYSSPPTRRAKEFSKPRTKVQKFGETLIRIWNMIRNASADSVHLNEKVSPDFNTVGAVQNTDGRAFHDSSRRIEGQDECGDVEIGFTVFDKYSGAAALGQLYPTSIRRTQVSNEVIRQST